MSKKALVVDNDFLFVEFLTALLEKKGYEVTKAYHGQEGVSILDSKSFDLIATDLVMPKIDGTHLIRFARRKSHDNYYSIIAVSSTMIEQRESLNELGADYYIAKGPLEYMEHQFNKVIDKIESEPADLSSEDNYFQAENTYAREATLELIKALNFKNAIIESLMAGIIVADKNGRILMANTPALTLMGRSIEDLLNAPITAILPEEERGELMEELKSTAYNRRKEMRWIPLFIHSKQVRLLVSQLVVEGKNEGWVIVMDTVGQASQEANTLEESQTAFPTAVPLHEVKAHS